MKIVIQRVSDAQVTIDGEVKGKIGKGFVVLIGAGVGDTKEQVDYLVKKLIKLRVFEDEQGKMNLDIKQIQGELLLISQFTLYADCTRGNRPSFIQAEGPEKANALYEYFIQECKKEEIPVQTGIFGADMKVELQNDGPVTILMENEA